ncbi:hypothetical protein HGG70_05120 [Rhodobacteraceae bacterium R_SAG4]|nr:hypothetical protein [Rhodobacteraceae bacterium R_SAG4]
MLKLLEPYWDIINCLNFDGSFAAIVRSKTRNEFRVALRTPKENRWRFSPAMSEQFAKTVMTEARRDASRGSASFTSTRHMLQIYARESTPARWRKHRINMEQRREIAAMRSLPQFGVF